jgi:hypothetical protein
MAGILPVAFGIVKSALSLVFYAFQMALKLLLYLVQFLPQYIIFCVISSLFISIFMLGGFIGPLLGIMYFYYTVYKLYMCFNNNTPTSECL